jgi:predicted dienelactone hydrolase
MPASVSRSSSERAALRSGEADNSYRDERVRAVFAMAPGLAPVFTLESLGKISIPVAIATGKCRRDRAANLRCRGSG